MSVREKLDGFSTLLTFLAVVVPATGPSAHARMRAFAICVLLILIPLETTLGETPESIIGTWQFDSVRTISEHFDRVAKARSDVIDHDQVEAMKAGLAVRAEEADPQVSMTITEDTITSTNPNSGTTSAPYTVIGGNSRLFVIESTDDEGYAWVINIRLVEGGIAIETTDPETRPEQWERERRRAMEQITKRQIDGLLAGDTESRIRLMYFRAATAE